MPVMKIKRDGEMADVPATIISDGLAVTDEKILTTFRGRQYVLFHVASGSTVSTGRTKRIARRIGAILAPLADWTLSQSELQNVEGLVEKILAAEIKAEMEEG
jgi:hypothetical protein